VTSFALGQFLTATHASFWCPASNPWLKALETHFFESEAVTFSDGAWKSDCIQNLMTHLEKLDSTVTKKTTAISIRQGSAGPAPQSKPRRRHDSREDLRRRDDVARRRARDDVARRRARPAGPPPAQ